MEENTRLVALVTGGSRGIGAATALALAGRGFDVRRPSAEEVAVAVRLTREVELSQHNAYREQRAKSALLATTTDAVIVAHNFVDGRGAPLPVGPGLTDALRSLDEGLFLAVVSGWQDTIKHGPPEGPAAAAD